jgi:signal transduction histidine kinase
VLPSLPIKYSKNRLRIVWSVSLFLSYSAQFLLGSAPWTWAYGSYLLWALTSGYIWDRKAPFLTVGIFCVMSASLSWEVLSTNPWRSIPSGFGLWVLLVFLSSLVSTLHFMLHQEQSHIREVKADLLQIARFHVWGRMTVGLGHELRNQIAIVTGYLDQMREDELSPAHRRKIERSLLANDKMLKLLTQLSLLTRDTMHEPLQPLAIPEVLQNALDFVERPLDYHSIHVRSTALPDLPRALGHPSLMQTLFMHLILHSVDRFRVQDGSDKEISMDFTREGAGLRLHYRDNARSSRTWTYVDRTLAEHMLQRLGGSLEESPDSSQGWDLNILFKTLDSPPDSSATAKEECS